MKRLITIILALIMTFYTAPQKGAEQTHVTAEKPLQTAITTTVEQVPEESEKLVETAFVGEVTEAETTTETPKKEVPAVMETVTEECTEVTEEIIIETEEDTVECIDEGDQSLVEYKPQIGGQPNPFENDIPTEIDDRPVEDYVGEGEDRPEERNTLLKYKNGYRLLSATPILQTVCSYYSLELLGYSSNGSIFNNLHILITISKDAPPISRDSKVISVLYGMSASIANRRRLVYLSRIRFRSFCSRFILAPQQSLSRRLSLRWQQSDLLRNPSL